MTSIVLSTEGLSKTYGARESVRDLTFRAPEGSIIGLLGPNGAGKTTTIRMLTTLLAPTRGAFQVLGIPHTSPDLIRRHIGVLPESSGYYANQTGRELLSYFGRLHGLSAGDARSVAATLLDEVGLSERADSRVATYSRGMKQRLGIARALVNDPRLVFLDEPTLGLDPAGQQDLLTLVRTIAHDRGTTILLSTHLLAEAEDLCDRILILNQGRLIAQGTVNDVRRLVAAPRTARINVPAIAHQAAETILREDKAIATVQPINGRPGQFSLTYAAYSEGTAPPGTSTLVALQSSGIPVLRFDLEGARLNDAFLALTREASA